MSDEKYKDSVLFKDVVDAAKQLLSPTFVGVVGSAGYYMFLDIIKAENLSNEPYISGGVILLGIGLLIIYAMLLFAWGFVLYLYIQYVIDKKKSDELF